MKLIQVTFVVISKSKLKKKWVQVLAGRWVHCMSFRRPCMMFLDRTWEFISGKAVGALAEAWVRSELLNCCAGCWLFHTNLRAGLSDTTTASDASSTGGAVGCARSLTKAGGGVGGSGLKRCECGSPHSRTGGVTLQWRGMCLPLLRSVRGAARSLHLV